MKKNFKNIHRNTQSTRLLQGKCCRGSQVSLSCCDTLWQDVAQQNVAASVFPAEDVIHSLQYNLRNCFGSG